MFISILALVAISASPPAPHASPTARDLSTAVEFWIHDQAAAEMASKCDGCVSSILVKRHKVDRVSCVSDAANNDRYRCTFRVLFFGDSTPASYDAIVSDEDGFWHIDSAKLTPAP